MEVRQLFHQENGVKVPYSPLVSMDAVIDSKGNKLTDMLNSVSIYQVTYAELKTLRSRGELIPGSWYRITDYECTVDGYIEARAVSHPFDIIVRADDVDVLNENAYAALHKGDTYFRGFNLNAWCLKYSLDNDKSRFDWADQLNGKGVIYWMKDEWGNTCSYDFKSIQFKRYYITDVYNEAIADLLDTYLGMRNGNGYDIDEDNFIWCYTFNAYDMDNDEYMDAYKAINKAPDDGACCLYDNVIPSYCFDYNQENSQRYRLNNITFQNRFSVNDYVYFECYANVLGSYSHNNSFGNDYGNNTFGNSYGGNTFGNNYGRNTFGNYYHENTFGNYYYWITSDNGVQYIQINCSTGSSNYLQYLHILSGTKGNSSSSRLTVSPTAGKKSCQFVGLNSSGSLRIWIPADAI